MLITFLKSFSLVVLLTPTLIGGDNSVFGLPLGSPFVLPECEKKIVGSTAFYGPPKVVCFERITNKNDTKPIINDSVLIIFPISDKPSLISGTAVVGLVIDGNLEGIGFNTLGYSNQDLVLLKLKEKYGSPTSLVPKKVQNNFGATFDTFDAVWTLPELHILFQSVASSLSSGLVNIDTIKGRANRDAKIKDLLKEKRPL